MGRLGHAHAALFLASDEANFITGVLLPVDAGCPRGSADDLCTICAAGMADGSALIMVCGAVRP